MSLSVRLSVRHFYTLIHCKVLYTHGFIRFILQDSGCDVEELNRLEEMFYLVFDSCKPEENVHSREMTAEVMGSEEFLNIARVAAASTRLPFG